MVDINLLPEDLRAKEQKAKKAAKKKPRIFEIKLTNPTAEKPLPIKKPPLSRGFWAGFRSQPKPPAAPDLTPPPLPSPTKPVSAKKAELVEIPAPKIPPFPATKANLSGGDFAGQKIKPVVPKPAPRPAPPTPPTEKLKPPLPQVKKVEVGAENLKELPARPHFLSALKSFFSALKFRSKTKIKPEKPPRSPKRPAPPKGKKSKLVINLIPEELARHPEFNLQAKFFTLLVFSVIAIFLLLGVFVIIEWTRFETKNKIEIVAQKVADLNKNIKNLDNSRLSALQLKDQLTLIEDLLNTHLYWTKIFEMLEKYTIDEVYYLNFSATEDGSLILSAVGRDYKSAARQLTAFQQAPDFVQAVSINSASLKVDDLNQTSTVAFDINLQLIPEVFLLKFETTE